MAARIGIRGRLAKQVKKMETRAEVLEDEARHLRKEADSLKHAIALIIAKKHDRETEEGYKANARRRLQIAKELGLAVAGVLKQRYR